MEFSCDQCPFEGEVELKFEIEVVFGRSSIKSIEFWCQDECPECGAEVSPIASVGKIIPTEVWAKEEGGFTLELVTDG